MSYFFPSHSIAMGDWTVYDIITIVTTLYRHSILFTDTQTQTLEKTFCLLDNKGIVIVEDLACESLGATSSSTWLFDRPTLLQVGNQLKTYACQYAQNCKWQYGTLDQSK